MDKKQDQINKDLRHYKEHFNNVFKISEFDCPGFEGSGSKMNKEFLGRLSWARILASEPFFINSGYRSKEYNDTLRRLGYPTSPSSSHLTGCAADIRIISSASRFNILNALIAAGFTRIGVGKNFIHVDTDPNKPQNIIWTY